MQNIIRLPDVQNKTGLSRSTIYLRISKGEFPASIKLGPRAVGWLESDIDKWIGERVAESRPSDINDRGLLDDSSKHNQQ